jgi:hypothetical protein
MNTVVAHELSGHLTTSEHPELLADATQGIARAHRVR